MVGFLLWDPYFFGYDSKLLGLGINGQVMLFQDMCQPAGAIAASGGAVVASVEVVSVEAVAASVGVAVGIFG